MSNNLLALYKQELLEIIEKILPGCKIILFGSRASGTAREGSDIDIGLDMGKAISFEKILEIYVALDNATIPVKIDLVDIYSANEDIKREIQKKGIIWKT